MLAAIFNNKAGRINTDDGQSIRWQEAFSGAEDLMSASFFERFNYLSEASQHKLIVFLLDNQVASNQLGALISIEYWPRFALQNDSQSLVEPDIILRFEEADILIEVKLPTGNMQYSEQWQREIKAVRQQISCKDKPLYFMALGGVIAELAKQWLTDLRENTEHSINGASAKNWHDAVVVIKSMILNAADSRDKKVLEDMLAAIGLFGEQIITFKWHDFQKVELPLLILPYSESWHKDVISENKWQCLHKTKLVLCDDVLTQINRWGNNGIK